MKEIEEVLKKFNFANVHLTMQALDTQWEIGKEPHVPSIMEMKVVCRELLTQAMSTVDTPFTNGGFLAVRGGDQNVLSLAYIVTMTSEEISQDTMVPME